MKAERLQGYVPHLKLTSYVWSHSVSHPIALNQGQKLVIRANVMFEEVVEV